MNSWAARIKTRMKELKMTQEVLARKMGVTRGAITHYLAGRRVPPLAQFQKLASVLTTNPAWLQFGASENIKENDKKAGAKKASDLAQRPIPILSWQQAAEMIDVTKISSDEIKEFLPHYYTNKPRWYALRIKGDAMTAPTAQSKSFHEADIIIVDPNKTAENGNYVIALMPRAKEATFKQYVVDGGVCYLKPLNSQYPTIQIDESTHICGIIVTCIKSTI